ncbi:MAG: DNA alkylation repair protein [Pseudomonadota bacterium]
MSEILALLRPSADPDKAAQMTTYHKTRLPVLGVGNPVINATVKAWRTDKDTAEWLTEAQALWGSGIFEARIAAGKLLVKARYRTHEAEVWETILGWMPDLDGWAISDHVADAGSRRVMADLDRLDVLEGWTTLEHLWRQRAALIFTLPLAKLTHPSVAEVAARERVLGWAGSYTTRSEWFLQKAVSWWLRTLAKHDPARVSAFVEVHGPQMKPFARKDALRGLPDPK